VLTGLTSVSSEPGSSSKANNKTRSSFEELLAKYEKKGAAQKPKRWLKKVKDANPSSGHREQSGSYPHQGNFVAMPYSFDGLVALWFWSYPCYYAPLDYSRMHMQSYFIEYPSIYPSCGSSQRPIIASNNLVKRDLGCSKEGEKNLKQNSKYLSH